MVSDERWDAVKVSTDQGNLNQEKCEKMGFSFYDWPHHEKVESKYESCFHEKS